MQSFGINSRIEFKRLKYRDSQPDEATLTRTAEGATRWAARLWFGQWECWTNLPPACATRRQRELRGQPEPTTMNPQRLEKARRFFVEGQGQPVEFAAQVKSSPVHLPTARDLAREANQQARQQRSLEPDAQDLANSRPQAATQPQETPFV